MRQLDYLDRGVKNLMLILVTTIFFACAAVATDDSTLYSTHSDLGKTFVSVANYAQTIAPDYLNDPDLDVLPIADSAYTWIIDRTPGHNYIWYLFKTMATGQTVLVFYTPAAAYVDFDIKEIHPLITAVIPALPDFPIQTTIFRFIPALNYYVPSRCLLGPEDNQTSVPCAQWYAAELP